MPRSIFPILPVILYTIELFLLYQQSNKHFALTFKTNIAHSRKGESLIKWGKHKEYYIIKDNANVTFNLRILLLVTYDYHRSPTNVQVKILHMATLRRFLALSACHWLSTLYISVCRWYILSNLNYLATINMYVIENYLTCYNYM